MTDVLIVGAGPTGLTAALQLAERGIRARIIDKRVEPSPYSRAFGVNPRTLTLLESTGVTERMLAQGWRLGAINVWRNGKPLFKLNLSTVTHRYPFMLVHSQAKSEALMVEALNEHGIQIERAVALERLTMQADAAEATLCHPGGHEEVCRASVLFGADGPRSTVRTALSIPFVGSAYDEPWKLYDLELDTPLARDEAHAFLLDDGGVFAVRLDDTLWRVIGNVPDLLERLPHGTALGHVVWASDFAIEHRIAGRFQEAHAYLAGDAAHIHAGLGARGMNLGVEDAYVFAVLAAEGRLQDYQRLRYPIDEAVMRQVERITAVPRGKTRLAKAVRSLAPLLAPMIPLGASSVGRWVLGLDHEVRLH